MLDEIDCLRLRKSDIREGLRDCQHIINSLGVLVASGEERSKFIEKDRGFGGVGRRARRMVDFSKSEYCGGAFKRLESVTKGN